jgi:hypothetical protein
MNDLTDNLKEIFTSFVDVLGMAVWVEILTGTPACTYYFGPFSNLAEAEKSKLGYIEDLEAEGATGIVVTVKRCKPDHLTIFDESVEIRNFQAIAR